MEAKLQILLFVDADVKLLPDALNTTVSHLVSYLVAENDLGWRIKGAG